MNDLELFPVLVHSFYLPIWTVSVLGVETTLKTDLFSWLQLYFTHSSFFPFFGLDECSRFLTDPPKNKVSKTNVAVVIS